MDQGRGIGIVVALFALGACGDDGGGGDDGPPAGFAQVFADDFAAGTDAWLFETGYRTDDAIGRPAPALVGELDLDHRGSTTAMFSYLNQSAVLTGDFEFTGDSGQLHVSLTKAAAPTLDDAAVDVMFTKSDSTTVMEVDCPHANTVLVPGFVSGFHHVDVRTDAAGTVVTIDGTKRCTDPALTMLAGDHKIFVELDASGGHVALDNVKLYRK